MVVEDMVVARAMVVVKVVDTPVVEVSNSDDYLVKNHHVQPNADQQIKDTPVEAAATAAAANNSKVAADGNKCSSGIFISLSTLHAFVRY